MYARTHTDMVAESCNTSRLNYPSLPPPLHICKKCICLHATRKENIHTSSKANKHICIDIHTQIQKQQQKQTYIHADITHEEIHTNAHTNTQTKNHANALAQTNTHILNTHTHMHAYTVADKKV